MSNLTSLPLTLVTVTLMLKVWFLTFISQFSSAPTFAGKSVGQVTASGLLPAASVNFEVICLAMSPLFNACDDEHEQTPAPAINPAAAAETSNVRMTE